MNIIGTHVAGTAGGKTYGVAKNANIIALKVLNKAGSGGLFGVLKGLEYALSDIAKKSGKGILNMSLGGSRMQSLNDALDSAFQKGLLAVVSAGNNNVDACMISPASAGTVISVGALQKGKDELSSYSNYGVCVDIFAPGDSIKSATSADNQSLGFMSGTSMAGPLVAGVAALFMEAFPNANIKTIRNFVLDSGILKGKISCDTKGSPNRLVTTTAFAPVAPVPVAPTGAPTYSPTGSPTKSPTSEPTPRPSRRPVVTPVAPTVAPPVYRRVDPPVTTKVPVEVRVVVRNPVAAPVAPAQPREIVDAPSSLPECCLCPKCANPSRPSQILLGNSDFTCGKVAENMPKWYSRNTIDSATCQDYQNRFSSPCCSPTPIISIIAPAKTSP